MKTVDLVVNGSAVSFEANEVEFYTVPPEDEDGTPLPNAGQLSGYRFDTEGLNTPIIWLKVSEIDAIVVREKPKRRRVKKTEAGELEKT